MHPSEKHQLPRTHASTAEAEAEASEAEAGAEEAEAEAEAEAILRDRQGSWPMSRGALQSSSCCSQQSGELQPFIDSASVYAPSSR